MNDEQILELCRPIGGWMHDDELLWLAGQARRCRLIVEVGVWQGKSTLALAMSTPGIVYAVDHWRGAADELDSYQKQAATAEGRAELFAAAMKNLWPAIEAGKCVPIALPSAAAAELLGPYLRQCGGADMIFIDAGHSFEDAAADLSIWRQLLAEGGLFCGHDREHAGVSRALAELLDHWTEEPGGIWSKRL